MIGPTGPEGDAVIDVGECVRRARESVGLSQTEVALEMRERGHLHWRQNTTSRIELGKQALAVNDLIGLASVLRGSTLLTDVLSAVR